MSQSTGLARRSAAPSPQQHAPQGSGAMQVRQNAMPSTAEQLWNAEQIKTLKQFLARNTTDAQFALFANVCQRTGLDPFAKQVYCIVRNGKGGPEMAIQISIDGLRLIAMRSGKFAGIVGPYWRGKTGDWSDVWLDEKQPPAAAKVGVWREGFKEPTWAVVSWHEFSGASQFWRDRPAHMLAKVAESHALRRGFQSEIAAAQYHVAQTSGVQLEMAGNRRGDERLLAEPAAGDVIDVEPHPTRAAVAPTWRRLDARTGEILDAQAPEPEPEPDADEDGEADAQDAEDVAYLEAASVRSSTGTKPAPAPVQAPLLDAAPAVAVPPGPDPRPYRQARAALVAAEAATGVTAAPKSRSELLAIYRQWVKRAIAAGVNYTPETNLEGADDAQFQAAAVALVRAVKAAEARPAGTERDSGGTGNGNGSGEARR